MDVACASAKVKSEGKVMGSPTLNDPIRSASRRLCFDCMAIKSDACCVRRAGKQDAMRTTTVFLAAQAYIFERMDKTAKSHHGVQTEFLRPTKDDKRVDTVSRRFLSQSYEFKSVADRSVGPDAVISQAESIAAVATAKRFVDHLMSIVHVVDVAPDTD